MVLNKFKEKSIFKIIKKRLGELAVNVDDKDNKISSMLIIIDFNKTKNFEVFEKLMKKLSVRTESYRIVGFLNKVEKDEQYPFPVYNEKTIKRNGTVKSPELDDVMKRKYDLVISYYEAPKLPLLFMTSMVDAGFRIGIGNKNTSYNNLVIDSGIEDYSSFEKELIKYLSILNKI
ncbi:hypothetical protein MQE36_14220 [Zhouia spongiae]|uniref:Uncharacterized protein n=1 Tax=Zhouia spongiae TaxID=2202721 RepID=A0ABY3YK63_9FLAO|nr:hypothetical protein [Zhouia spongiae]UNY98234.1 hypothetical protein MQE36_14220 [Zhouia spongiae]